MTWVSISRQVCLLFTSFPQALIVLYDNGVSKITKTIMSLMEQLNNSSCSCFRHLHRQSVHVTFVAKKIQSNFYCLWMQSSNYANIHYGRGTAFWYLVSCSFLTLWKKSKIKHGYIVFVHEALKFRDDFVCRNYTVSVFFNQVPSYSTDGYFLYSRYSI